MSKRILFVLVGFIFFFSSRAALANVSINEVMYNSDGSDIDWVEVYNPDSADVDLTNLYLLISNSTSNHGINKNSGTEILHSGDYGVIVASSQIESFISRWGNSGNLFTSSFSLPNVVSDESATISVNAGDKLSPVSSFSYQSSMGADGDGNSLQLINGAWKAQTPTPFTQNSISSGVVQQSSSGGVSAAVSTQSTTETKTKVVTPSIKTKIITKNLALVGIPTSFQASNLGYSDEVLRYGKCFWNFGDGDSKEQLNSFDKFTHTFAYPGEYSVSLEYYSNYYGENPDAVSKFYVNVIPLPVTISKMGDEKDFFIELTNNSDYQIDISNWVLSSLNKKFVLPKNTFISSKNKMILSPKITNFTIGDEKNLKLLASTGETIFDYESFILNKEEKVIESVVSDKEVAVAIEKSADAEIKEIVKDETVPLKEGNNLQNLNDQLVSGVIKSDSLNKSNSYLFFIGFTILLVVSSVAVYFIRRRNVISVIPGNDFEILDE